MKKIIYLFLTLLIVGCSSDDTVSVSFEGSWKLSSISENGVDVHNSCDLESYMLLTESNTGTYYQYYSDNLTTEPCGLDVTYNLTWSKLEGSNYLITFDFGQSITAVLTSVLTLDYGDGEKFVFVK